MALVNEHFLKLPGSYLFSDIAKKINTFRITHPKQDIIRLGIGDVTQPLPKACIEAMHKAVEELADKDTFRGYGPEQGYDFLIEAIIKNHIPVQDHMTLLRAVFISPLQRYSSATEQKAILEISEIFSVMTTVSASQTLFIRFI